MNTQTHIQISPYLSVSISQSVLTLTALALCIRIPRVLLPVSVTFTITAWLSAIRRTAQHSAVQAQHTCILSSSVPGQEAGDQRNQCGQRQNTHYGHEPAFGGDARILPISTWGQTQRWRREKEEEGEDDEEEANETTRCVLFLQLDPPTLNIRV